MAPCRFLRFEVPDAVRLGVADAGFFDGGFPADVLLACRFDLAVLPEHEFTSPVGKRVYGLRHACLTTWLDNGIPPAQVAEWAGNSVPVLLSAYARCITGQIAELQ